MTVRPLLTDHELAELADLLAERVHESGGRHERHSGERTGTLLTADELAEILGVPTGWIYRQSRAGRIPTVKLGRCYRYRLEAIERWIVDREDAA
jgi:excisionase family DNA binding protein